MMDCLKFRGAGNPLPSPNSSPKLPQLYTTSPGTEHLKLAAVPFPRIMLGGTVGAQGEPGVADLSVSGPWRLPVSLCRLFIVNALENYQMDLNREAEKDRK